MGYYTKKPKLYRTLTCSRPCLVVVLVPAETAAGFVLLVLQSCLLLIRYLAICFCTALGATDRALIVACFGSLLTGKLTAGSSFPDPGTLGPLTLVNHRCFGLSRCA